MARISGVDIPREKRVEIALTYIHGIGRPTSAKMCADLGINPSNDGVVIRLNFPPLTEERRKEYVKVVKHMAEDGRVAVRNVRRDARKHLESAQKAGEISEDDLERAEKEMEKITHEHVEHIDKALERKEHELLEV